SFERRLHTDVDAAPCELARRVIAEPARDLRQDRRRCVDENPVLLYAAQRRVVAERVADEIAELRERLHAGIARADEDESELPAPLSVPRRSRRGFEPA